RPRGRGAGAALRALLCAWQLSHCGCRRRAARHRRARMNERSLRVDGLKVRCLEQGKGAAVLLLHGASLGSSADVWARNLALLASHGLRVIAPDLPGFGHTENPADHSLAYRQRFVLALMDALELDRASLVAHSQAGRIAVGLAFREPPRLAKGVVPGPGSLLPRLEAVADGA